MADRTHPRVYRERIKDGVTVRDVPRRYKDGSFHVQEKHGEASNQSIYTVRVQTEDELIERLLTDNYYLRMEREDGSSSAYSQIVLATLIIPEVSHSPHKRGSVGGASNARSLSLLRAQQTPEPNQEPYKPSDDDRRELAYRRVRERQGQTDFRKMLICRYGSKCMISRYGVFEVVEAAHIHPYRGDEDNHPENGLLLRADLHTLFDVDLLGIEPQTLVVKIHPSLKETVYWKFDGMTLSVGSKGPSIAALEIKWRSYQERLRESLVK